MSTTPEDDWVDEPVSAYEELEFRKQFVERQRGFAPDALAPPVDVHLLRAFRRQQVPEAAKEEIIDLITSFRLWNLAWNEVLREG
jgi:hypothetical protein